MVIRPGVELRLSDVELRTSRSSGPGGQHANVTASRVEAVLDVAASSLPEECKRRVLARLGPRVTATAHDTRSQARNRELALERLRGRLESALTIQRPRRATKPTAASRRRRADSKRRRGEVKRLRRRPEL
jgi:ribosome-associated protein